MAVDLQGRKQEMATLVLILGLAPILSIFVVIGVVDGSLCVTVDVLLGNAP
jgi:hypothetical protein